MDRVTQQRIKKQYSLPPSSSFLGYVINLPMSDEYLALHESNDFADNWGWAPSPFMAKRFKKLKYARRAIRDYDKNVVTICYLFDTPDSLQVIPVGV